MHPSNKVDEDRRASIELRRREYESTFWSHARRPTHRFALIRTFSVCVCSLLILLCLPIYAHAAFDEPKKEATAQTSADNNLHLPRHRIVYQNLAAGRVAPLGLVNRFMLGYRLQLVDRDSALFRDSFAALKFDVSATPTFFLGGIRAEIQPAAVLRIGASYHFVSYFGNLGNLQSFGTPKADASPESLRKRNEAGLNYATHGQQLTLDVLLQVKFGPAIVRSEFGGRYTKLRLKADDRVYFDRLIDSLVPNDGWSISNNLDLLYQANAHVFLGARHSYAASLFEKSKHYREPEGARDFRLAIHRLGPAIMYQFYARPGSRFDAPTLFLLTQWHLKHPYRTGQSVSTAVPTVMFGLIFNGDLWRSTSKKAG